MIRVASHHNSSGQGNTAAGAGGTRPHGLQVRMCRGTTEGTVILLEQALHTGVAGHRGLMMGTGADNDEPGICGATGGFEVAVDTEAGPPRRGH